MNSVVVEVEICKIFPIKCPGQCLISRPLDPKAAVTTIRLKGQDQLEWSVLCPIYMCLLTYYLYLASYTTSYTVASYKTTVSNV